MSAQVEETAMEYQPWMLSYVDCLSPLDPSSSLAQTDFTNMNNNIMCVTQSNSVSNGNSNSNSNGNNSTNDTNGGEEDDCSVMKRLSHNARERDRRKKLNALYASLRSLLPSSDHKKKLSIATTVSRVLKFIPEQRQEVERLCRRKEEIMNTVSRKAHASDQQRQRPMMINTDSSTRIVPTWLSDTELALHITTSDSTSVSDMLLRLEEIGLRVISFSSSASSRTRGFYTLHLEMDRNCKVGFEEVSEMLMALQEKQDQSRP